MNEFVYQKASKSELLVNKDLVVETEVLEEGSRDLYDIIKFCKENMAGFKRPKHVIFGELPKTSTGKIQKFELRTKAKEL